MKRLAYRFPSLRLIALALCAGACSGRPPEGRTLDIDTEVASLYLFHPDDLQHRKSAPSLWPIYDFAIAPEFAAGRLVAFGTGADGGFRMRLTEGDLLPREKTYAVCSWDFRYRVAHGRVLIDDGDQLPAEPDRMPGGDLPDAHRAPDPIPDDHWFDIANGDYRVTVTAINWENERGAVGGGGNATKNALPAYVVQFKRVPHLDVIKSAPGSPRLAPTNRAGQAEFHRVSANLDDPDTTEPLPDRCPVVVAPELVLVPGFETSTITIPGTTNLRLIRELGEDSTSIPVAAIVESEKVPRIACLGNVGWASGQEKGAWTVSFQLQRLVRVTKIDRVKNGLEGTIADFVRLKSDVTARDLCAIKSAFSEFAKTNQAYRKAVKHPDFEAERVSAMTSASSISTTLLHHIPMAAAARAKLLPLPDAERITALLEILK